MFSRLWSQVVGDFWLYRFLVRAKGKEFRLFPPLYFYRALSFIYFSIIDTYRVVSRFSCAYQNPGALVTILMGLSIRVHSMPLRNETRDSFTLVIFFRRILSCVPGKVRSLYVFSKSSISRLRPRVMVLMEVADEVAYIIVDYRYVIGLLGKMRFSMLSPTGLPSSMGKKILLAE